MLYNGGSGNIIHWYPFNNNYDFGAFLPNRAGWYNITVTWDGISNNKMYFNGVLVMSSTTMSIPKPSTWSFAAGLYNPQAIRLQSIQTYNKILTQAEVLQNHYKGNIVTDGLVLCVDAGNIVSYESGSTITYNLSSSTSAPNGGTLSVNLNGTLTNGTSFNGDNGGSWVFDGVDDYVDCGNILFNDINTVTISIWVNIPSFINSNSIISKGAQGEGSNTTFAAWIISSSGVRNRFFNSTGTGSYVDITSLSPNTWYNLTWTYNGSVITSYTNSIIRETASLSGSLKTNTNPIRIGRDIYGNNTAMTCASTQIYNRALISSRSLNKTLTLNDQDLDFNLVIKNKFIILQYKLWKIKKHLHSI
jgi:hypothetical protein